MTIEEAKTKVCPFMSNSVANATDGTWWEVKCICGNCMAWQYTKETSDEIETKTFDGIEKTRNKPLLENEKEGYCKRLHQ